MIDNAFYLSADPSANRLSVQAGEFATMLESKQKFELARVDLGPTDGPYDRYDLNPKFAYQITGVTPYIDSKNPSTFTYNKVKRRLDGIIQYKGLILRENAEFRLRIQKLVETFRQIQSLTSSNSTSCVWVHARKGDRTLPDEYSMTEWCKAHAKYNKETNRNDLPVGNFRRTNQSDEEVVSDSDVFDLGCPLALPYGSATLEHFLNASLILSPNNRNIFISTDDDVWLTKAISEYKSQPRNLISEKHLQIFRFHPHRNHRNEPSKRTAAEFFATIELGQHCEGFVGYPSKSTVAMLFYEMMCYYHRYTYLHCPPLFDLGMDYHREN